MKAKRQVYWLLILLGVLEIIGLISILIYNLNNMESPKRTAINVCWIVATLGLPLLIIKVIIPIVIKKGKDEVGEL